MCGVLNDEAKKEYLSRGSSPRVRGFEHDDWKSIYDIRFIPACAGFCFLLQLLRQYDRVHPRVCGVLLQFRGSDQPVAGSSPRVRGFVFLLYVIRTTLNISLEHNLSAFN